MNNIQRMFNKKLTENGDISYKSTGNNLIDIFFMTSYFEKHLDEVHIGNSNKDKVLAMYIRDGRYGLGRRDLGRELMYQAGVTPEDIVKAGRYDDLWHIARDVDLAYLHYKLTKTHDKLVKKWLPRLTSKDKDVAKELCKIWHLSEKQYRSLIKTDTTEYKLSYAEKTVDISPLSDLFHSYVYEHPLVDKINFEEVPSLAMKKYLHCFSTREDLKDRFNEYMQQVKQNKKKINVSTTNVVDARNVVMGGTQDYQENKEILGKKIVDNATVGVQLNAIVVLDTSGSMGSIYSKNSLLNKAMAIAHGISTHSTYAKNQLISFSSYPKLMTIHGKTLEEQYNSMFTGDCSNTDFAKVMKLLSKLETYPEYIVVISDMEFDYGSKQSKDETMKIFDYYGANTKIIWWNLNDRNKTVPELDEYGNIFVSGYNLQLLKLLNNKFDMTTYLDKILKDYCKKIGKDIDF